MSWIKRQKIRQLNTDLEALRVDVERCQKELSDVGLSLFSGSSGTTHDRIWDIWGDNPWTDWRVIKETNHLIEEMSLLETAILSLRQSLNES